ncbi:hypothetical protein TVAG_385370 [Trichomonas vaginalis G3]|uniref:Uncharacterized protein n=1 Tax=Trichomonas vaginalis (strain ATCC PRA-98 / G3) TaxID=412133 RepID=A2FXM8_TRIV3|nr:Ankyrin repeat family [Trichomonas vaginalis G3]EAX90339.1 hypothetical protein TVAG_385370 [Trichomonas vaginalis G3]KAI5505112.1 Ankyrin repeat family [Trichomonas vaginalis G3]|eukprot:XP_001303269.1 hypothetical protein [Trichomonas vaginalis G3]
MRDDVEFLMETCYKRDWKPNHTYGSLKLIDWCSKFGSYKCFKFLKELGAEITNETLIQSMIGGNSMIISEIFYEITKIDINNRFLDALLHIQDMNLLIDIAPKFINLFDYLSTFIYDNLNLFFLKFALTHDLDSALCTAVYYNISSLVVDFVELGADVNGKTIFSSPFLAASKIGNLEMLKLFCEHGCDLNKFSINPFHFAAKNDDLEMADFLYKNHCDIYATELNNKLPIEIAISNRSEKVIRYLLLKDPLFVMKADFRMNEVSKSIYYEYCRRGIVNWINIFRDVFDALGDYFKYPLLSILIIYFLNFYYINTL